MSDSPQQSQPQDGQETKTPDGMELLNLYRSRVEHEAGITWNRNTYFLVVMSLLTLAYTQKPFGIPIQLFIFQLLVVILGILLSIVWLFIQYRSSKYIEYYKDKAQALSKSDNLPEMYPDDIPGFEIRNLVYWLPIVFITILLATLTLQVVFMDSSSLLSVLPTPTPTPIPTT